MLIELREQAIDPWREVQAYQTQRAELAGQFGATALFVGSMRDFNQGDQVRAMYLEHYPGMTEKQLQSIVDQAHGQWALLDSVVLHRVGQVQPQDVLVLVATWAVHRGDAYDGNRYIMEQLKSRAPFWKRETLDSGQQRWVEHNSDGYRK